MRHRIAALLAVLFVLWSPTLPHLEAAGLNCDSFPNQKAAQEYLRQYPWDPDNLDGNRDGIACNSKGCPCDKVPVALVAAPDGSTATTTAPTSTPTPTVTTTATQVPSPTTTAVIPTAQPTNTTSGILADSPNGTAPTCPQSGLWLLLYWRGQRGPIATVAGACPGSDLYWVNREGRWLGYSTIAPAASDIWNVETGEAQFVHGGSSVHVADLPAKVVRVIDGDTVDVQLGEDVQRLRLIGIDTPETVAPGQPVDCYGPEASNHMKTLLTGQAVTLQTDPTQDTFDRYDRLLVYIFLGSMNVNEHMIREGFAREYTYRTAYRYQAAFKAAEVEAKQANRGLWAACSA